MTRKGCCCYVDQCYYNRLFSPLDIIIFIFIRCGICIFFLVCIHCYVQIARVFFFSSIALGFNREILVTLNPNVMFFFMNDWFKALSTQPIKVVLFSAM